MSQMVEFFDDEDVASVLERCDGRTVTVVESDGTFVASGTLNNYVGDMVILQYGSQVRSVPVAGRVIRVGR